MKMTEEAKEYWDAWNQRIVKGRQLIKEGHFPECYMVADPDDPEVYCTCVRNMCPDD